MNCSFNNKELGRINYEAYREIVGGVSWNGERLKEYDELTEKVQKGWIEGALEVIARWFSSMVIDTDKDSRNNMYDDETIRNFDGQ